MENYKELLTALYKEHAPEKLDQVDFYLNKYEGKEKQFYITQKAKYANKKSVIDSKKILEEAMARINKDKKKSNEDKPDKPTPDKEKSKKESPKKEDSKESVKVPVAPPVKKEKLPIEEQKLETPKEEKKKEALKQDLNPPILKEKAEKKEPQAEKAKEEETIAVPIPIIKEKEKPKAEIPKKPIDHDALNKQKEKKDKRRFPILWFLSFILFFIIAAFLIYFFWYRDLNPSKAEGLKVEKVQVDETNNTVLTDETETDQEEPAVEKEMIQPTADRLYASNLQKPVIFVACFAEKKEELAQKKVALLKEYGLMGHYYWIPDIDPQGNAFFKIVVGPFKTNREAYPSLTKVQERINFDAYILVVK